jgi:hypothetical protein
MEATWKYVQENRLLTLINCIFYIHGSWNNVVSVVTSLQAGQLRSHGSIPGMSKHPDWLQSPPSLPYTGLDRPLGFQEVKAPRISRQSAHEGGKVVSIVLISVRGWINPRAIVRPEGLSQWKLWMTPLGIKPATFWLVVQCLNQLRQCVPLLFLVGCDV